MVMRAYFYFTTTQKPRDENTKKGKLRRPKFLPVHHTKRSYYIRQERQRWKRKIYDKL